MIRLKRAFLAAGFAIGTTVAALAHHSNAAYDMDHAKTIDGTVKSVNWTNPHITFHIDTDAKEGAPAEEWAFEASSPGVLTRSGWSKRSLQPGDHASFEFAPLRDGAHGGFLRRVTLQSGEVLSYNLEPAEQQ